MKGRFTPPFSNHPPGSQVFIFCALASLCLGITSLLSTGLIAAFYGNAGILENWQEHLTNPEVTGLLKIMQVVQSAGLFILPPLLMARLSSTRMGSWLGLTKPFPFAQSLVISLSIMVVAQPFINWLAAANQLIPVSQWMRDAEKETAEITLAFLRMDGMTDLLGNILVFGLIPGFGEELFFRGFLQPRIEKWTGSTNLSVWLVAIIFSAMHMQFLGFIPRLILGAVLGYLRVWTGSLWPSVIAHTCNNSLAVILHYAVLKGGLAPHSEEVGILKEDTGWVLASSFVLLYLMRVLHGKWAEKTNDKAEI